MKIVNREEFMKLPPGTFYAKYRSTGLFDDIAIKGDSTTNDWWSQPLFQIKASSSDEFLDIMSNISYGDDIELDFDSEERDGFYDEDQLFAVYERKDLSKLIDKLLEAHHDYPRDL